MLEAEYDFWLAKQMLEAEYDFWLERETERERLGKHTINIGHAASVATLGGGRRFRQAAPVIEGLLGRLRSMYFLY
jgi:hypothetical protein